MTVKSEVLYWPSPVGILRIAASEFGITGLSIVGESKDDGNPTNVHLLNAANQLERYFNGDLERFSVELDLGNRTDFEKKVWNELGKIPFGSTCSYSELASKIGNPRAARAVGKANGDNPIAIIIPCHRLVGKDGKLRGYAYGLDVKSDLLELERHFKKKKQQL